VLDRSLVLSVRKRVGRIFDAEELPRGFVPFPPANVVRAR
jgi:hypothetical protein